MGFFDELHKLHETQPHPAILTVKSENSEYCPYHGEGKNSYMIVGHMRAEDCLYGFWVGDAQDCVDCAFTEKSEFCYECVDCRDCYSSNYCQDCLNCSFCEFCYDCKGCMNCFGCVNLRNKEYYIFNEKYDKASYEQKMQVLRKEYYQTSSLSPARGDRSPARGYRSDRQFYELVRTLPHNYLQGFQNENAVGDHIFHSKNAFYCFDVNEIEDCFYMFNAYMVKDSMDTVYTNIQSELNYMCMSAVNIFNSNYCSVCWYSQNLEYCEYVFNSHDCFGCVSRNHAEYEILNKKYSKEDYFKKVRAIKEQLKAEGSYGRWWWPQLYPALQPTPSYMALQYYQQSML